MVTISANVSDRELDAIREYANSCGETISNLIRKCLVSEAVFRNFYGDASDYSFGIRIPNRCSGEEEDRIILDIHNKIRRILGLDENDLI